jgi:SAM-dependent methyltransferase
LIHGSIFDLYPTIGQFDLIFADSGAGKRDGRQETVAALKPSGILLMADMAPPKWHFERHESLNEEVRQDLLNRDDFISIELPLATGATTLFLLHALKLRQYLFPSVRLEFALHQSGLMQKGR